MIPFIDTNILVYAQQDDQRSALARELLRQGGVISAQVLNEFANVLRRKMRRSWHEIEVAVEDVLSTVEAVVPLTAATHHIALELARDHNFAFYDALIVASALEAGCATLFSEDLQDGRAIGGLRIVNPFG